jgi:hypothetical protein
MGACEDPEARQLDFWIGEWDVIWEGGAGTSSITSTLDGCVILENFDAMPTWDFQGMSVSAFSAKLRLWQQTWVDNAGNYWHFTGGMDDGRFIFTTQDTEEGREVSLRMVFSNISPDGLDWSWEGSDDCGSTWTSRWQIHYKRRM